MLHYVSWSRFLSTTLLLTGLYYLAVALLFYRKEVFRWLRKRAGLTTILALSTFLVHAQDGVTGITQANTMIRSYFDVGTQLLYGIGGLLALVGAVRVFREWNSGHRDQAQHAAAAWFGSCIFLVVVATVIRSFFGL